jgi:hypothetical protein
MIMAADSRKIKLYEHGVGEKETMKKIIQVNDYYYAVSGINSDEDLGLDVHNILISILKDQDNPKLAVPFIANQLAGELKNYFTSIKNSRSAKFQYFQKYRLTGGEVFIVKRVDQIPTAYLLEYYIHYSHPIRVTMKTGKIDVNKIKNKDECFWRAIGNTSFLNYQIYTEKEMAVNPVINARKIIEEGIRKEPVFVGPPITILELTANGETWLYL